MDDPNLANCWTREEKAWAKWIAVSLLYNEPLLADVGSVASDAIQGADEPGTIAQRIATILYVERAQSFGKN